VVLKPQEILPTLAGLPIVHLAFAAALAAAAAAAPPAPLSHRRQDHHIAGLVQVLARWWWLHGTQRPSGTGQRGGRILARSDAGRGGIALGHVGDALVVTVPGQSARPGGREEWLLRRLQALPGEGWTTR
jgi:hypothetical protein